MRNTLNKLVAVAFSIKLKAAFRTALAVAAIFFAFIQGVSAQNGTNSNVTPSGNTPGSGEETYAISRFEDVNLYNGNLNLRFPLTVIKGRDGLTLPLFFSLSNKSWSTVRSKNPNQEYYLPRFERNQIYASAFGTGVVVVKKVAFNQETMSNGGSSTWIVCKTLTRIFFTDGTGARHELRDVVSDGQVYVDTTSQGSVFSRGTVFVANDASNIRFVSDVTIQDYSTRTTARTSDELASGWLFLGDGTRYRIDSGKLTKAIDPNGNTITAAWTDQYNTVITDSLGRTTTLAGAGPDSLQNDSITYPAFNGTTLSVQIVKTNLGNALRSDFTLKTSQQLFPELPMPPGTQTVLFNPIVVSQLILPDGRIFRLKYNSFGEIARIELPTGGALEYDYTPGSGVIPTFDGIYRRLTERRVYLETGSLVQKTTYQETPLGVVAGLSRTSVKVIQSSPTGTPLGIDVHYFFGDPSGSLHRDSFGFAAVYNDWHDAKEYKSEMLALDGVTVLRRTENTWGQRVQVGWYPYSSPPYPAAEPSKDPRLLNSIFTNVDSNLVTKKEFDYDQDNNQISQSEFSFGVGAPGQMVRTVEATFLVNDNSIPLATRQLYRDRNLLSLATSTRLRDGSGAVVTNGEASFDEPTYAPLTYVGVQTGWEDPGNLVRGKATTNRFWLNTANAGAGGWVETHAQFDQFGNSRKTWDQLGRVSETEYDPVNKYAFPTLNRTPIPDITGQFGSSTAFTSTTVFDFSSGLAVSSTDQNGQTTTMEYNDVLNRQTAVNLPGGGARTEYSYGDTVGNLFVKTRSQIDSGHWREETKYLNGVGQEVRLETFDVFGNVFTDRQFDSLGRLLKVSNPYRIGNSVNWTTNSYDALGRILTVTTPDNAVFTTSYGASTTGMLGTTVTTTDQSGKVRRSITDALGRLVRVDEPDGNNQLGVTSAPNQATTYVYNVQDNLTQVSQGIQTRNFTFDTISRLISVTAPESGTTSYTYDAASNMLTKTDARGVVVSYQYDSLDRPRQQSYTLTSGVGATSTKLNYYDGTGPSDVIPNFAKGKLTKVLNGEASYEFRNFDALGRVLSARQIIDGKNYDTSYTYNLEGALVTETYPSGRTVTNTFAADGDLSLVSGRSSGNAPRLYASNFEYAAHGGETKFQYGNGLWEEKTFNSRLQVTGINLKKQVSSLWNVTYDYGTTDNNGNVKSHSILHPGITQPLFQSYGYDPLNRLTQASETQNSVEQWKQRFSYDRYGNRTVVTGQTSANLVGPNPVVNPANNRITPQGSEQYLFDSAGNMISDKDGKRFVFDGENKVVSFALSLNDQNNQIFAGEYRYDTDGRRVKKIVGNVTTVFVYDAMGRMIAEYAVNLSQPAPRTQFLTADTMSSQRVITDGLGTVTSRRDFAPFGEELPANAANRQPGQGYQNGGDATRQKFATYERDDESGLDFAQSRYYASGLARFCGADPLLASGKPNLPQSWNRYVYVWDNPLRYFDENGMEVKSIKLVLDGPNKVPSKGTPSKLGIDRARRRLTWNIVVEVTDDDSPENYEPYEDFYYDNKRVNGLKSLNPNPAFIRNGHAPPRSLRLLTVLDFAQKIQGNQYVWAGQITTNYYRRNVTGILVLYFRVTVTKKDKKATDIILYLAITVNVVNGQIVDETGAGGQTQIEQITQEEYEARSGIRPWRLLPKKKKEDPPKPSPSTPNPSTPPAN